ncbi:MAG: hypothetical protein FWE90_02275 [Defluviitaleaceae bacterium]|nr:hypothetical protein [Defluviitaleaceae bacterium]
MDINERKNQWRKFYDLSSNVKTLVLIDYPLPNRPWPYPENFNKRLDWASESYQRQSEHALWLHDDRIPALNPYTGTELFAEAFGCKVHYSGDNMPFALPMISSAAEVASLREPDIYDGVLGKTFELGRLLRQRNGDDAVLHLPDIQSPLDIAALMWEKGDFFMAMLEEPNAINALTEMTENVLCKFLDAWFKEFGTEYISHYPDFFMDGGFTVSEDEVGAFGPAQFKEFCLGALNRMSVRYGGIGMHCCAHATHQWENFKKIEGLRMLNFVQPTVVTQRAYHEFAEKTAMMHYWCGNGAPDPSWIMHYPQNAHVVLNCSAENRDEAIRFCETLRGIASERG